MKTSELNAICSQYKSEINRMLFNKGSKLSIGYSFGRNISNTIYLHERESGLIISNIGNFKTSLELENCIRIINNLLNNI
jgi:hypothetical protein